MCLLDFIWIILINLTLQFVFRYYFSLYILLFVYFCLKFYSYPTRKVMSGFAPTSCGFFVGILLPCIHLHFGKRVSYHYKIVQFSLHYETRYQRFCYGITMWDGELENITWEDLSGSIYFDFEKKNKSCWQYHFVTSACFINIS